MALNTKEFYDVDYENIKRRLKEFLSEQTSLKDYNFEGSAISTWLNIIAYVIFYINTIANFVSNELFISTAQIDENIYKASYQLNYLPQRKISPKTTIKVNRKDTSVNTVIPPFTKFSVSSVNLVTLEEYDLSLTNKIELHEGEIVRKEYVFKGDNYETIILDDKENIDWNYFHVYVNGEEWESVYNDKNYNQAKNFFIRYLDNFEVRFDKYNGFFAVPEAGDDVLIVYLKTNGSEYNNTNFNKINIDDTFEYSDNIEIIEDNYILDNGEDEETLESIATNAPLFYTSAGRCVTEDDYNYRITKSPIYKKMYDMVVYSGHKDAVDYNENPIEELTEDTKIDKGFYIYSGYGRYFVSSDYDTDFSEYYFVNENEKKQLEDYFSSYKFMQIFGKYRLPNFLVIQPNIRFTNKKGTTVELTKLKEDLHEHFEKYVGFNKSLNSTDVISYIKNTYEYISYITCDFIYHALAVKPYTRLKLDDISKCKENCKVMIGDAEGVINHIEKEINVIEVSRTNDTPFQEGTINIYENDELIGTTECTNCFNNLIIRLNKYVEDVAGAVDDKTITVDDITTVADKRNGNVYLDDEVIGYINYETGYIEFTDKFTWDGYENIPLKITFLDDYNHRPNDISVSFETALDFQNPKITYTQA